MSLTSVFFEEEQSTLTPIRPTLSVNVNLGDDLTDKHKEYSDIVVVETEHLVEARIVIPVLHAMRQRKPRSSQLEYTIRLPSC